MNYNTVLYEVSDRILMLTLNRPESLNAFTLEMGSELIDAFQRASNDDEIGAIIVTGAGRAFCAGMDLNSEGNVFGLDESLKPTLSDLQNPKFAPGIQGGIRDGGGLVALAIFECTKPVIAAINGPAVGVGATMTCAMDVRLASEKARIGFVFNKIGITPETCSTWFLPRIVGMSRALEWCYSGEILPAAVARDTGLVSSVSKADDLLDDAISLAKKFTDKSATSIALTRQMLYRNAACAHPLDAHYVESLALFYQSQSSGREGVAAFGEKRQAQFTETTARDMPPFFPWWQK
jgi:enoyl-CoA hydratase/carnithine racemase|tara:strand:+ start:9047 stop:9925 length:879 start_codon:yes stop_codon:yes gene_type:complete